MFYTRNQTLCCFGLIYYDPSLFLYPSIKIVLTGAALYWQTLIISALKGNLRVLHDQGREHSEQFLHV
jgi:hypothetical protein